MILKTNSSTLEYCKQTYTFNLICHLVKDNFNDLLYGHLHIELCINKITFWKFNSLYDTSHGMEEIVKCSVLDILTRLEMELTII
jgi:hypothetical protein